MAKKEQITYRLKIPATIGMTVHATSEAAARRAAVKLLHARMDQFTFGIEVCNGCGFDDDTNSWQKKNPDVAIYFSSDIDSGKATDEIVILDTKSEKDKT
jgi:hypothetical protein